MHYARFHLLFEGVTLSLKGAPQRYYLKETQSNHGLKMLTTMSTMTIIMIMIIIIIIIIITKKKKKKKKKKNDNSKGCVLVIY